MERKYKIYLLICLVTHMGYIGQTSTPLMKRIKNGKGYSKGSLVRQMFDEYGPDNFVCIVLEEGIASQEEADEREQYWIETLGTIDPWGYNREGGGRLHNSVHSETKKILSVSHTGENNPNYGKHFSVEHKDSLSKSNRNNPKQPCQKVRQLTENGEFIAEYPSIMEAYRQTKINRAHISACCSGKRKTAGKCRWELAD